jgi:hypothetical protein
MDVALEVLKWAAVVFAAGVVGQLGKSLTLKFLAARRLREPAGREGSASDTAPAAEPTHSKGEHKQRKKQLKTEAKLRKKNATSGQRASGEVAE